jgi:hypothetical protein
MDIDYIAAEGLIRSKDLISIALTPLIDEFVIADIKVKHCKFKGLDNEYTKHLQQSQDMILAGIHAALKAYQRESEYDFS